MSRFCTALREGRHCTTRALPGQSFCYIHHPAASIPPERCAYFTRTGDPCRKLAMRGQDHCFTHSPRNRRVKHAALPLVPRTPAQLDQVKALLLSKMPHPPAPLGEQPRTSPFSFNSMPPSSQTHRQTTGPAELTALQEMVEAFYNTLVSNELPHSRTASLQSSRNQ